MINIFWSIFSHNKETVWKKNDFFQAFESMKRTIFLQWPRPWCFDKSQGSSVIISPHNIPCMEYMEYLPTWIAEYSCGKCWVNIPVPLMLWVCFLGKTPPVSLGQTETGPATKRLSVAMLPKFKAHVLAPGSFGGFAYNSREGEWGNEPAEQRKGVNVGVMNKECMQYLHSTSK